MTDETPDQHLPNWTHRYVAGHQEIKEAIENRSFGLCEALISNEKSANYGQRCTTPAAMKKGAHWICGMHQRAKSFVESA